MPKARREEVLARVDAWMAGMRAAGLDPEESYPDLRTYHRARLACPLLDQEHHRCTVYEVRPMSCRGHFVLARDASPCANRAEMPVITEMRVTEPAARAVIQMGRGHIPTIRTYRERLLTTALVERLR